ncbi:MAG: hypothetical protein ACI9BW_002789 [Gammaproteobacteria bacterium]
MARELSAVRLRDNKSGRLTATGCAVFNYCKSERIRDQSNIKKFNTFSILIGRIGDRRWWIRCVKFGVLVRCRSSRCQDWRKVRAGRRYTPHRFWDNAKLALYLFYLRLAELFYVQSWVCIYSKYFGRQCSRSSSWLYVICAVAIVGT